MQRIKLGVLAVTFIGFMSLGIHNITQTQNKVLLKDIQLKDTRAQLLQLEHQYDQVLQKKTQTDKEKQQQAEELQRLQKQLQDAQRELQARATKRRLEQEKIASAARMGLGTQVASAAGNSCAEWMAQAGIPLTQATNKLILNESGCRTNAVNPKSGACGIPQAYPCSKLPCPLNNSGAVCQLRWMDTYVKSRYGSWEAALAAWYSRCGSPQGCWY